MLSTDALSNGMAIERADALVCSNKQSDTTTVRKGRNICNHLLSAAQCLRDLCRHVSIYYLQLCELGESFFAQLGSET